VPKKLLSTLLGNLFLLIVFSSSSFANESHFDNKQKAVVCSEPLPIFTLRENSNPSKTQVQKLCKCIWDSLPEGGWERDAATKARNNQKPNSRLGDFIPKFGESLKKCGGYQL
jgi:hypothetical protein